MEKIKIELSKINSETVKFGKNKVLVLPIISTFAKIEIIDICLQQFRQNNKSLPLIKTIYDIAILGLQTNVDVPEFEEINDGNNREIKIKLNSDIVYNYETSGIFDVIKDAIYNYRETWK